jgi:hypothetical protein
VQDEQNLVNLRDELKLAEQFLCDRAFDMAIAKYMDLALVFIEQWREYHVSAYLYQKCMELAK